MVLRPERGPSEIPEPRRGGSGFEGPGPRWGEPPSAPPPPERAAAEPPRTLPPFVTIGIAILNVAMYGIMVASGIDPMWPSAPSLVPWGADSGFLTLNGDWWRLITACFLHGGFIHLASNMYVFWSLGRLTEGVFGPLAFVLVYLVAGIGGNVASVVAHPDLAAGVGASGAVFGVAGAFLAFLVANRGRIRPDVANALRRSLITFVLVNVAIGYAVPIIDQAAHLGGLATGFVTGLIASPRVGPSGPERSYARLPIVAAIGVALCAATALGLTRALAIH